MRARGGVAEVQQVLDTSIHVSRLLWGVRELTCTMNIMMGWNKKLMLHCAWCTAPRFVLQRTTPTELVCTHCATSPFTFACRPLLFRWCLPPPLLLSPPPPQLDGPPSPLCATTLPFLQSVTAGSRYLGYMLSAASCDSSYVQGE